MTLHSSLALNSSLGNVPAAWTGRRRAVLHALGLSLPHLLFAEVVRRELEVLLFSTSTQRRCNEKKASHSMHNTTTSSDDSSSAEPVLGRHQERSPQAVGRHRARLDARSPQAASALDARNPRTTSHRPELHSFTRSSHSTCPSEVAQSHLLIESRWRCH